MEAGAIERAAAAAWPATEVEERDDWVLRSTPGLDRHRSNAALPLTADADPAVPERWYAERGLPAMVQVGPLEERGALDAELAGAGWAELMRVDVLAAPVADVPTPAKPVAVLTSCVPRWVGAWAEAEERADAVAHTEFVFSRVPPGRAAYALALGGKSVGMAILTGDGACGLFCTATRRDARGQGLAAAVVGALAEWAGNVGAHTFYLQVLADNAPAHALYERAGFERSHGYVHRSLSR